MTEGKHGHPHGESHHRHEDTSRCIVAVWQPSCYAYGVFYEGYYHQCLRLRGHGRKGFFCKQHAKKYKEGYNRKCDKE